MSNGFQPVTPHIFSRLSGFVLEVATDGEGLKFCYQFDRHDSRVEHTRMKQWFSRITSTKIDCGAFHICTYANAEHKSFLKGTLRERIEGRVRSLTVVGRIRLRTTRLKLLDAVHRIYGRMPCMGVGRPS